MAWWDSDPADLGDTDETGRGEQLRPDQAEGGIPSVLGVECPGGGGAKSRLGRVAHGVAHRVDRLKAIGNGQVPAVVVRAWETLHGRMMEAAEADKV